MFSCTVRPDIALASRLLFLHEKYVFLQLFLLVLTKFLAYIVSMYFTVLNKENEKTQNFD